jgi:hypothetical protein
MHCAPEEHSSLNIPRATTPRCIPCNGNGAHGWPRYGPDEAGTQCLECPGVPNGGNVTDNGTVNRAVCIPGPGAWGLYWPALEVCCT